MFGERRFNRFVVFRERTVSTAWAKEMAYAVSVHDERQAALFLIGKRSSSTVDDITLPRLAIPPDDGKLRIPGLAMGIHGGAVIEHAAVDRPAPGPLGIQAESGLLGGLAEVTVLGLVAVFLCVAVAVQPVEGGSGTVSLEITKGGDELALMVDLVLHLGVLPEHAVDTFGPLFSLVLFAPVEAEDRIRERTAFLPVEVADFVDQRHEHVAEVAGFAGRLDSLVKPLQPASGVGDRAFLLDTLCGREEEHLGLHLLGIDAGTVPVIGGLGMVNFTHDEPVKIVESRTDLVGIREALAGVDADDKGTAHLVLLGLVNGVVIGIVAIGLQFGHPAVAEVVLGGGVVTVPALEQTYHVLGVVGLPVGAVGKQRLGSNTGEVILEGLLVRAGHAHVAGEAVIENGVVSGPLNVRFAAEGVNTAAGDADIAEEELDDGA